MQLSDLIQSVDIVEYISQFVDLEEKNGEFWGLSPFTSENTPSFSVRREEGSFFDFSSGIGGNVFTFVRYYNKCSARKAIDILKEYSGISGESIQAGGKLSATCVCNKFKPKEKRKEVASADRGERCMEIYERPEDKLVVWEAEGISRKSLDEFNVCYDRFSDRLVYPIRDMDGKIVNIGGRTLDPDWKQKKLRKYTYFYGWGGAMRVIYGLFDNLQEIKKRKEVILFEGCKSVLLANTWGIKNTGAILTSHLSPEQMKILAKLGCRVVFALDKEIKIRDDHNISKLKKYVNVEYLVDVDDELCAKDAPVDRGKDVFLKLYKNRRRLR